MAGEPAGHLVPQALTSRMAVLLETTAGDIVIDLHTQDCPRTTENFLKLCAIKYFNRVPVWQIQHNFIAITGDPEETGKGGSSIWGVIHGEKRRFFKDEIRKHLRHEVKGTVAMAGAGENRNASQFYITLSSQIDSLDGKHTVFGAVSEGLQVLDAMNEALLGASGRPVKEIRIRETHVLEDPFPDPPELPALLQAAEARLEAAQSAEDDDAAEAAALSEEEARQKEAQGRAVVLEMIGDLPEADSKPPSNMLFIAKLNPVTTEEDLEIIFSRFGHITSCDIIRDWKTGDSLCYAFLGYDTDEACEAAYFKMNNVLIDDRRIKVDFSQSVHHLWQQFRRHGKAGTTQAAPVQAGPPLRKQQGPRPKQGNR